MLPCFLHHSLASSSLTSGFPVVGLVMISVFCLKGEHERRGRTAWLSAWAMCSAQIDLVAQHEEGELLWVVRACVYQKLEDTRRNSFPMSGRWRRTRE